MDEILSNAQLRHDLIFDSDLKFKASDADDPDSQSKTITYWSEVKSEIDSGLFYRLPLLLAEIRAILVELLPSGKDLKQEIFGMIDPSLISQQIQHGIMNPASLITYIASIMKVNCAPIRDVVVDRMVEECGNGMISECLQTCFEILELMKLVLVFVFTLRIMQITK
jgi:T-complex protein 11